jgi:hypothetical protein
MKKKGELRLRVLDHDCQKILREKNIIIKSLGSGTIPFYFEKIAGSKDKMYCISLDFTGENNIQLRLSEDLHPDSVSLYQNANEIKNQSLSMRPAYQNKNRWQDIQELNQRISQYKPWFLKHYFLYFIAFGFILLSFLLVAILILL